ncbi:MAG: hypothetical protein ACI8V2_003095 [Candidatus Latescibacterota bacterium]|jgi:hypothetical protein
MRVEMDLRYLNMGDYVATVIYTSDDLNHWVEEVRFQIPSFARSFEYHDGRFYVGLGTNTAPLNEASGNVYRATPPSK